MATTKKPQSKTLQEMKEEARLLTVGIEQRELKNKSEAKVQVLRQNCRDDQRAVELQSEKDRIDEELKDLKGVTSVTPATVSPAATSPVTPAASKPATTSSATSVAPKKTFFQKAGGFFKDLGDSIHP